MNKFLVKALLVLMLSMLAACSPSLTDEIDNLEEQWLEQAITSYEIEVLRVDSIWHAQSQRITVQEGAVVDASATCIPGPVEGRECEVRAFNADDFTVAGLFATARTMAQRGDGEWTKIEYDEQYGFPVRISYNDPEILDEDTSWQVKHFALLP